MIDPGIDQLTRKVAAGLGDGWTAAADPEDRRASLHHPDGRQLYLGRVWNRPDRLAITGALPPTEMYQPTRTSITVACPGRSRNVRPDPLALLLRAPRNRARAAGGRDPMRTAKPTTSSVSAALRRDGYYVASYGHPVGLRFRKVAEVDGEGAVEVRALYPDAPWREVREARNARDSLVCLGYEVRAHEHVQSAFYVLGRSSR